MDVVVVRHFAGATGTLVEDRFLQKDAAERDAAWLSQASGRYSSAMLDAPNGKILGNGLPQYSPDWPEQVRLLPPTRFIKRKMYYLGCPSVGTNWSHTLSMCVNATHVVIDASSYVMNYEGEALLPAVMDCAYAGIKPVLEAMVPFDAPRWMRRCGVMFRSEWMRGDYGPVGEAYVHPQEHPEAFCFWDGQVETYPDAEEANNLLNVAGNPAKPFSALTMAAWATRFFQYCAGWRIVPMMSCDWAGGPERMWSMITEAQERD